MTLQLLLIFFIILYWFSEGVTEGYTWANKDRRIKNKLVHPNNLSNGIMDYHGWRLFENIGIWGTVLTSFLLDISLKEFLLLGIGSWLIGTTIYEFALNHIYFGTIWKPTDYRWHIFGYNIPWFGGKKSLILITFGILIILYNFLF